MGPLNFQDPHVLGRAIAAGPHARGIAATAIVAAQQAHLARHAPPPQLVSRPPERIPLKRTLGEMIADLEARQQPQGTAEMPAQIMSLADALKHAQEALARAPIAAQKITENTNDLVAAVGQVEELSVQIAKHTAGVRALLGGISNGGPPLDDKPAS